eukprot:7659813-Ditylum_brightwellii.AAC.1
MEKTTPDTKREETLRNEDITTLKKDNEYLQSLLEDALNKKKSSVEKAKALQVDYNKQVKALMDTLEEEKSLRAKVTRQFLQENESLKDEIKRNKKIFAKKKAAVMLLIEEALKGIEEIAQVKTTYEAKIKAQQKKINELKKTQVQSSPRELTLTPSKTCHKAVVSHISQEEAINLLNSFTREVTKCNVKYEKQMKAKDGKIKTLE